MTYELKDTSSVNRKYRLLLIQRKLLELIKTESEYVGDTFVYALDRWAIATPGGEAIFMPPAYFITQAPDKANRVIACG